MDTTTSPPSPQDDGPSKQELFERMPLAWYTWGPKGKMSFRHVPGIDGYRWVYTDEGESNEAP